MKLIKVAAGVLNQTPLDWQGNASHIRSACAQARAERVGILCLPELAITGYGCEDAFHSKGVEETACEVLLELLPETRGLIVSLGLPLAHNHALYNAACLVADGRILGFAAKKTLAGGGIHYEPRWFRPWPRGERSEVEIAGESYPLGDLSFELGGVKLGFEICEDAWGARRPGANLAFEGVDVILNPSASHFAFGKHEVRQRIVLEGSRAFGVSYIYTNLVGNEAGRAIYDGGGLIASAGRLLAAGPRFSFADAALTTAIVDIDATRLERTRTASLSSTTRSGAAASVRVPFHFADLEPEVQPLSEPDWERGPHVKEEELARALTLGLFDYLRKSRSEGFVVSLSGGADSSAVACLTVLMARFGTRELGLEGYRAKLAYAPRLAAADGLEELVRETTDCVYQATRNSSETTRAAARGLATALGTGFLELDVDAFAEGYVVLLERALARPIAWKTDDVALQNIQARVRAPSVWLLANLKNALLLATSNRSEAAVGYATMDGDTCGGLSPIAGIDKAFLRRWLRWLEQTGPEGLGPVPALGAVNAQQPTAELRPPEASQTDEADLMPYDLLDAIERAAIRDKQTPLEVFRSLAARFPQHAADALGRWVERFFRLWCRNQWKRERYAPSFHVDDANLDPKTWCRFPILSGGFERELGELRAHLLALEEGPP